MLTDLDETLAHQAPVPFVYTNYSDHRFFDRVYLGGHGHDGVTFFSGMAAYKNMNAFDGFFCVRRGDRQYNVRASRTLQGPNALAMAVGPLSLEVVKPLEQIRYRVAPGAHPLEVDIVFTGASPAHLEAPHLVRQHGRLAQDYVRFDQVGAVDGHITVEGERIEVAEWFSCRDHSWGVRPGVGGFEPETSAPSASKGMLFIWLAFRAGAYIGQMQTHEGPDGGTLYVDGHVHMPGAEPGVSEKIVEITHDIDFLPDSRVFRRAVLNARTASGQVLRIEADALLPPWVYKGAGYDLGFDDEKGLGAFRGERVESDVYDVSHPEIVVLPDGRQIWPRHREQPVRLTVNGVAGDGHLPIFVTETVNRYRTASRPPKNTRQDRGER